MNLQKNKSTIFTFIVSIPGLVYSLILFSAIIGSSLGLVQPELGLYLFFFWGMLLTPINFTIFALTVLRIFNHSMKNIKIAIVLALINLLPTIHVLWFVFGYVTNF